MEALFPGLRDIFVWQVPLLDETNIALHLAPVTLTAVCLQGFSAIVTVNRRNRISPCCGERAALRSASYLWNVTGI
ncbi:hypothetical protein KCP77_23305 [Salmonella enterica subsp. enterica]|nr:hypothetical protein KCP77_23305 [Salmonella enterica subsp. enterica]